MPTPDAVLANGRTLTPLTLAKKLEDAANIPGPTGGQRKGLSVGLDTDERTGPRGGLSARARQARWEARHPDYVRKRKVSLPQGLKLLKELSQRYGVHVIGTRTKLAKDLTAYRHSLVDMMGGPEAITPTASTIIDIAVRTRLYLDAVDCWCTSLVVAGGMINTTSRKLAPILMDRQKLASDLARLMDMLGLERRAPEPIDLARMLQVGRSTTATPEAETATSPEPPTSKHFDLPEGPARAGGDEQNSPRDAPTLDPAPDHAPAPEDAS